MEIIKADEPLRAAQYCYKESLYNSSVSRAYYSMYQAQVALEAVGLVRPELSLLANGLCPEVKIEATTETFEDAVEQCLAHSKNAPNSVTISLARRASKRVKNLAGYSNVEFLENLSA
jgi:hypothetical protein